jgi:hypothetical protein
VEVCIHFLELSKKKKKKIFASTSCKQILFPELLYSIFIDLFKNENMLLSPLPWIGNCLIVIVTFLPSRFSIENRSTDSWILVNALVGNIMNVNYPNDIDTTILCSFSKTSANAILGFTATTGLLPFNRYFPGTGWHHGAKSIIYGHQRCRSVLLR